ncbi:MAG: diacylglycerol/polyprenol kinase family protein [Candidatus Nanohaloarchaea archaeon]
MRFETRRKLVHVLEGVLGIAVIYLDLQPLAVFSALLMVGIVLSYAAREGDHPFLDFFVDRLGREDPTLPGQGSLFMLAGFIAAVLVLPAEAAMAAVATVAFGDSAAAFIGRYYGRTRNPLNDGKTVEASVAGFVLSSFAAGFFVSPGSAVLMSFAAMVVEAWPAHLGGYELDDNFSMPVVAALVYLLVHGL